ncbi:MAG: hypothetical protein KME13_23425 [Myxacorys californica WJT36-NPBG1]|nr:hypothetical protein [Myxacorys californica WJT36-NPBG1]
MGETPRRTLFTLKAALPRKERAALPHKEATQMISVQIAPQPITATCAQCRFYDRGICQPRARAEWSDATVKANRPACFMAELLPF